MKKESEIDLFCRRIMENCREINADVKRLRLCLSDGEQSKDKGGNALPDKPELIDAITAYVKASGYVSTSALQRKFALGYARARRIADYLEEQGICGR